MKSKAVIERFDSLTSYANVIGKRNPNTVFGGRGLESETGSESFTLTASYDDSLSLMMSGYKEGLKNLTASKGTRVAHTSRVAKSLPTTDVVGYIPHIPNAITGIPQSMISTRPTEQKAKVISILYDKGSSARTDASRFVAAGRKLLEVIMTLELQGYRVGLNILTSFCEDSQKAFCIIRVKDHRQQSNPLKIAYPLLHPSFFRRQGFRWLETCPAVTDREFISGYGSVMSRFYKTVGERREYLRQQGVLEPGCFYTEFEEAEENTVDDLIKKMGIKK